MSKLIFAIVAAGVMVLHAADDDELVRVGGKGKVVLVDTVGSMSNQLNLAAQELTRLLMIEVVVKTGRWRMEDASATVADLGASAVVFVVKDEKLPMSLAAIESRWGVANALGLSDKSVKKETMRVAIMVLGGAYSKYPASVMRPVFTPNELETKAGESLTIDSLMAVLPSLESLGLVQYDVYGYKEALEEGIAPEPANDKQRRIKKEWEKEKAAQKK